ncbi:hypothetical protein ACJIZ3_019086 [Penstemon smallii]|uniref:Proteinase inhibitor I78 n=1 Tax=Penstemon smallii TaxID=265156 RepID=A0ABD3T079_9LAMI
MDGLRAKHIIEAENPKVTAVILKPNVGQIFDFCCNRVWVRVNEKGKVIGDPNPPMIG